MFMPYLLKGTIAATLNLRTLYQCLKKGQHFPKDLKNTTLLIAQLETYLCL